jgi:hypothetical protein
MMPSAWKDGDPTVVDARDHVLHVHAQAGPLTRLIPFSIGSFFSV